MAVAMAVRTATIPCAHCGAGLGPGEVEIVYAALIVEAVDAIADGRVCCYSGGTVTAGERHFRCTKCGQTFPTQGVVIEF